MSIHQSVVNYFRQRPSRIKYDSFVGAVQRPHRLHILPVIPLPPTVPARFRQLHTPVVDYLVRRNLFLVVQIPRQVPPVSSVSPPYSRPPSTLARDRLRNRSVDSWS